MCTHTHTLKFSIFATIVRVQVFSHCCCYKFCFTVLTWEQLVNRFDLF